MSNYADRIADDDYEEVDDSSNYAKETDPNLKDQVPVQGDDEQIDDPIQPPYSDSDQQLGKSNHLP